MAARKKASKTTARKATAKRATKKAVAKKPAKKKAAAKKTTKAAKKTTKKAPARKTAKSTAKKSASNVINFPTSAIAKKQTKAQIFAELAEATDLSKTDVKNLFAALRNMVDRHLKPKGSGQFIIPELGIKIRRVQKKATKARMGRNPFTGEEIKIPAKPASKAVRATVLKALKEVV